MPAHLVERINESLAAEQAQRASTASDESVTPLLPTQGRHRTRLVFAMAGAAAAVAAVTLIGSGMFSDRQGSTVNTTASVASPADAGRVSGGMPPSAAGKARDLQTASAAAPAVLQIGLSHTAYTRAGFVAQVEALRRAASTMAQPEPDQGSSLGPAGTAAGLRQCLDVIGAGSAQTVTADVASYEGQPAVIIVAITNSVPTAYVVGRQCSGTDAAVLRPATPLP